MLHGAYRLTLAADYGFTLPPEWRAAFADPQGVMFFSRNHWVLYPGRDAGKNWATLLFALHDDRPDPLPDFIREQIGLTHTLTLGPRHKIVIPAALRALPAGPVEIMGLGDCLEIWPVAAWAEEMQRQCDAPPSAALVGRGNEGGAGLASRTATHTGKRVHGKGRKK